MGARRAGCWGGRGPPGGVARWGGPALPSGNAMIVLHRHRRSIFGAYLIVVLVLLLAPITQESPIPELTWLDKLVHFVLFVGLAVMGFWNHASVPAVALFTVVLAGALELIQGPLPYRSAELLDFVAGVVGGVCGVGLAVLLGRAGGQAGGRYRPARWDRWKGGVGPPG